MNVNFLIQKFNEYFLISYNDDSGEEYFLEVGLQYPENLRDLYNDLLFLPENIKTVKVEKPVVNLHDKEEYVIQIGNFKQALNN